MSLNLGIISTQNVFERPEKQINYYVVSNWYDMIIVVFDIKCSLYLL